CLLIKDCVQLQNLDSCPTLRSSDLGISMRMVNKNTDVKYVPVLGIQEFRRGQTAGRKELLYNELHGERHIDKPHKHDFFIIVLLDRKSTRLNSSHVNISYAVFCLKK